jgi:hypothetical protein
MALRDREFFCDASGKIPVFNALRRTGQQDCPQNIEPKDFIDKILWDKGLAHGFSHSWRETPANAVKLSRMIRFCAFWNSQVKVVRHSADCGKRGKGRHVIPILTSQSARR